jgi:hypothetical protein
MAYDPGWHHSTQVRAKRGCSSSCLCSEWKARASCPWCVKGVDGHTTRVRVTVNKTKHFNRASKEPRGHGTTPASESANCALKSGDIVLRVAPIARHCAAHGICDRTWPQEESAWESDASVGGGRCLPRKTKEPRTPLDTSFGREGGWLEVQDVPLRKKKKRRSARTHWAWTGPHTCTHAHTGWVFWHGQAANVNRHSVLVISTNIGLSPGQGHPHSFFAVNLRDSMSARLPHFYEWRRYIPCFGSA